MKNRKQKEIEPILNDLKLILNQNYGERLKGIILFGSYARGDAIDGSDIDVLILLDNVKDPIEEGDKISEPIWKLDLKHDTVVFALPMDVNEYKSRRSPLILNVKKEGISL